MDVTCFNRIPILDADNSGIDYEEPIFIGGYEGSGVLSSTISFARAVDTNTGTGLPKTSEILEDVQAGKDWTRMYMDDSTIKEEGSDRIGVFNCVVDYEGVITNITTITMETEGKHKILLHYNLAQFVAPGCHIHIRNGDDQNLRV